MGGGPELTVPEELVAWCRNELGSEPAQVVFRVRHLSEVVGVRLASGRSVVLKLRPRSERLAACMLVQRHAWAAGFPCPEPLAGPTRLGAQDATAEVLVSGGEQLAWADDAPRLFAEALAWLVAVAPAAQSLPTLAPSPPWVGWDHSQPGTWPEPDDMDADLNAQPGPGWIEDAAQRVRRRLLRPSTLPLVIGHCDWESQNLRWNGRQLHVVHDWDSVVAQREATIAGAASAVFTTTGAPNTSASVQQSQAFLDAYEQARGRAWTDEERELAWAAGLWVRLFNARKATLRPGGDVPTASRLRLAAELPERLRWAGT